MKLYKSFCIAVVLIAVLFLTGCMGPDPKDAVNTYFEAIKKVDTATVTKIMKENKNLKPNDPNQQKLMGLILKKLNYKILDSKVEKDTATVKTQVTAPNMQLVLGKVVAEVMPQLFSLAFTGGDSEKIAEQMFMDAFTKKLQEKDLQFVTNDVTIHLKKDTKSKEWIVVPDDVLLNAITGNIVKGFEELEKSFNNNSNNQNTEVQPDTKIHKIGEEVVLGRAAFTLKQVEQSMGKEYDTPKEGNEFIIVTVKKLNKSQDVLSYSSDDFSIQTSNGQILSPTYYSFGKEFGYGSLAAGGVVEGNVVFEVPKGDSKLIFLYTPEYEKKAYLKFDLSNKSK